MKTWWLSILFPVCRRILALVFRYSIRVGFAFLVISFFKQVLFESSFFALGSYCCLSSTMGMKLQYMSSFLQGCPWCSPASQILLQAYANDSCWSDWEASQLQQYTLQTLLYVLFLDAIVFFILFTGIHILFLAALEKSDNS